jgi:DNA-binding NarL/FixJ family response regulator
MGIIKVAIADDHKIFRKGVILSLRPYTNIKFVLEAENGDELLKGIPETEPDVILMDLRMPGKDGIEATKIISKQYPDIKIVVLTMYEDERFVYHMMENGANGYLLKNSEPDEIRRSIYAVHENGYYFNDLVNKALLKKLVLKNNLKPSFNQNVELTERELEVLKLICEEKTAAEIAKEIYLSPRSVEGIRQRLIEKVGVRNSAGLVMFAVKNGLVD